MTISIPIGRKHQALVDDCDEYLLKYRWYLDANPWTNYAKTDHLPGRPRMHQVIMQPPKGLVVDHLDKNGLNCQRSNLEVVSQSTNSFRNSARRSKVPFRGVYLHECGKYCAEITVMYKKTYLGLYDTPEEAHEAYLVAVRRLR